MKLTLFTTLISAVAGFGVAPTAFKFARTSVVVHDSRNKAKIASRAAWAASRSGSSDVAEVGGAASAGLMKNEHGLDYVKLVSDNGSSAEVYLYGGVVTSYKDADGTEFIAVRPDAKTDGSKPISGGLSHCWPQFGPGAIQQHGFARNVNWTVKDVSDTTVELEMAPSDYTKEIWDKEFLCTFSVNIENDQLKTKMFVENKGEEAWDFQAALHSYFTVSSLENLEIAGSFEGKEFLNKMVGEGEMQTEERSSITIAEEYDRVYMGVNDPILKDSGTGKNVSNTNELLHLRPYYYYHVAYYSNPHSDFSLPFSTPLDGLTLSCGTLMAMKAWASITSSAWKASSLTRLPSRVGHHGPETWLLSHPRPK
jgi:glucose-6-phosphate 1-epimerase